MLQIVTASTVLNASMESVWDFFSSPANLKKITPSSMGFDILTGGEGKMYAGQLISYRVKPIAGIPMKWVTEITQVQPKQFFVDEQRFGPYRMWHHEHHFKQLDQGVEMTDIVSYVVPFGFFGTIANKLFVRKKVEGIFEYRSKVIGNYFEIIH